MPDEPLLPRSMGIVDPREARESQRKREQDLRGLEVAMAAKAKRAEERHAAQVHRERLGLRWTIIAGVVAILAFIVSVIALVVSLTR